MSTVGRVACAISGGVDSAAAAYLLKRKGYNVVGVHMVNWDQQEESEDQLLCPGTKDLADAKKICAYLNIELHVANFVKEYWNDIFVKLIENYRHGRAIVPDIYCNKYIKFDLFTKFVEENFDADCIATGHYVRSSYGNFLENNSTKQVRLLRAKDPIKDQTFFLSSLKYDQLRNVMFPIGSLYKSEVRKMAADIGLEHCANKPESMGICFIGKKKSFEDFLSKYIDPVEGPFVDIDTGKEIPGVRHTGVHNFTYGKRVRCHNTTPGSNKSLQNLIGNCEPLRVCSMDSSTQTVYVCRGSFHPKLYVKRIRVSNPNWISDDPDYVQKRIQSASSSGKSLGLSIQRSHIPCRAKIHAEESGNFHTAKYFDIEPQYPLNSVSPGQLCVFYIGDECLGCAEIDSILQTI